MPTDAAIHYQLIKDIRSNGMMYIRNRLTVEELKRLDNNIEYEYDNNENMYTVTHKDYLYGGKMNAVYKTKNK